MRPTDKRDPLVAKVRRFCQAHSLLPPGEKVLVALSGGVDSMVLLHLVLELVEREKVVAMHLNHCIRGEESDRDEEFVKGACRELGVEIVAERCAVPHLARERGLGMEEAARFARRRALETTAQRMGIARIATGHNLNDHVETMLVKLVQGTGLRGLCGISPKEGPFVRPLLETTRHEILRYARERGIPFVEDSTNRDTLYLRNWVRHEVLPLLLSKNPGFLSVAKGLSEVAREQVELLDHLVEEAWPRTRVEGHILPSLRLPELSGLHPSLQGPVILRFLKEAFPGHRMGKRHVEGIVRLLRSPGEGVVGVPGGTVAKRGGLLVAIQRPVREVKRNAGERPAPYLLEETGIHLWGGSRWMVRITQTPVTVAPERGVALSAEKVSLPLILRCRRPGDRIYRRGVGHKEVKKIMQEKGISREKREAIPLLVDPSENRVLWVAGLGADPRVAPVPGEPVLVVEMEE